MMLSSSEKKDGVVTPPSAAGSRDEGVGLPSSSRPWGGGGNTRQSLALQRSGLKLQTKSLKRDLAFMKKEGRTLVGKMATHLRNVRKIEDRNIQLNQEKEATEEDFTREFAQIIYEKEHLEEEEAQEMIRHQQKQEFFQRQAALLKQEQEALQRKRDAYVERYEEEKLDLSSRHQLELARVDDMKRHINSNEFDQRKLQRELGKLEEEKSSLEIKAKTVRRTKIERVKPHLKSADFSRLGIVEIHDVIGLHKLSDLQEWRFQDVMDLQEALDSKEKCKAGTGYGTNPHFQALCAKGGEVWTKYCGKKPVLMKGKQNHTVSFVKMRMALQLDLLIDFEQEDALQVDDTESRINSNEDDYRNLPRDLGKFKQTSSGLAKNERKAKIEQLKLVDFSRLGIVQIHDMIGLHKLSDLKDWRFQDLMDLQEALDSKEKCKAGTGYGTNPHFRSLCAKGGEVWEKYCGKEPMMMKGKKNHRVNFVRKRMALQLDLLINRQQEEALQVDDTESHTNPNEDDFRNMQRELGNLEQKPSKLCFKAKNERKAKFEHLKLVDFSSLGIVEIHDMIGLHKLSDLQDWRFQDVMDLQEALDSKEKCNAGTGYGTNPHFRSLCAKGGEVWEKYCGKEPNMMKGKRNHKANFVKTRMALQLDLLIDIELCDDKPKPESKKSPPEADSFSDQEEAS